MTLRTLTSAARRTACAAALVLAFTALPAPAVAATGETNHIEGQLPSGATYLMDVPADWNGTVLLFSHGYTQAGSPNPAQNGPDAATKSLLLAKGYALIGSSYATTGWAVTDAAPPYQGRPGGRRLDEPHQLVHRRADEASTLRAHRR